MNVLLISQCHKNALKETRRILDQFAERRGERTWQTAITQQGLDTLRRLLRQNARKNSAIACHWIRGKDHSELLWIVGDASQFNAQGAVPTNSTSRDLLRKGDENDWHSLDAIRLLVAIAALWHDMGKANARFQAKLTSRKPLADPLRHEWVSLRLWQAFVSSDDDRGWLTRLAELPDQPSLDWLNGARKDGIETGLHGPLKGLPPLAQAVGWLLVSHHRLPQNSEIKRSELTSLRILKHLPSGIPVEWSGARLDETPEAIRDCWRFNHALPFTSTAWLARIRKAARRALQQTRLLEHPALCDDRYLLHHARLALMLADHHYSSLHRREDRTQGDANYPLWANTHREGEQRPLNQPLDEHLIGVERTSGQVLHALPRLLRELPRLARHKGFRRRSADPRFRWQDRAFDLAEGLREASLRQGFFGINMASTGLGKTLANGRILYALADPAQGARFTIALGLRTLTLQTGQAYRDKLQLGADQLAVLVGGSAVRALYEHQQQNSAANSGSESSEALLPDGAQLHYEAALQPGPLSDWLNHTKGAAGLLDAPLLCCTIDHLMPATEALRGGHQIAPMLRLMTGDLVLDEPDDFGLEDLPALSRLVHWAGLLGSRVLLSSATLPPALVEALFAAYLEGRRHYQNHRSEPGQPLNVIAAWFDESGRDAESEHFNAEAPFIVHHRQWVERRVARLAKAAAQPRHRAKILPLEPSGPAETHPDQLAALLHDALHGLHAVHHSQDPHTGARVSFGLIRMANIDPLVATTRALAAIPPRPGHRIHLCCYHSHHPLLVRSNIERRLDRLLQRHKPAAIFDDPELRTLLTRHPEADHLFLVLATPVAEVGRDHDYDWAIVEPSSMRSIIQLAGRVKRHRDEACPEDAPNILLLDTNLRALRNASPAYCRPGFEAKEFRLETHRLDQLLTPAQIARIDASHRILERDNPEPTRNLVDLEHRHLRATLLPDAAAQKTPAALWWTTRAHLSGELQRHQPFRLDTRGRVPYSLRFDSEEERVELVRIEEDGNATTVTAAFAPLMLQFAPGNGPWGEANYAAQIMELAESMEIEPEATARRFGAFELPEEEGQTWAWHPVLGFTRT